MSRGSTIAHAKLRAKTGKSCKTQRARRQPNISYGENVAALALTQADLDDLADILRTLHEPQEIKVVLPACKASCSKCGNTVCEMPEREVTKKVEIEALQEAAAKLESITDKIGKGASLWFSR